MKPLSDELKASILGFAARKNGRIYAPILHPELSHLPANHHHSRFETIIPHLEFHGGTVLDVGTHWGYVAHRLEDMGYAVTAVEASPEHAKILKGLRDACERKFTIVDTSVFQLDACEYDIVFALNIFHHFLKREEKFLAMNAFLERLQAKMMIFEAHSPDEKQMENAFVKFGPHEMAHHVATMSRLPKVQIIGMYKKRTIFKLTQ